ncbi:MAG: heme-dependent oxidative N-demethylase subunit alpha family protein [Bacteroidota bacterium]
MNKSAFLFPVKVPFSTAPDIIKWKEPFQLLPITPEASQFKSEQISLFGADLFGEINDNNIDTCLKNICLQFQLPFVQSIQELGQIVQEDIAILSLGKVIAICFCSPSGFVPTHLLGKSFFEIHQPVPDAALLLKMSEKVGALLSDTSRGPYRRYVWTITANPSGNQHPSLKNNFIPDSIADLYFRTEVQTTVPLGDEIHALFAVKVSMTPLSNIWSDIVMRNTLIESLRSMSDEMIIYKNLNRIKNILENTL